MFLFRKKRPTKTQPPTPKRPKLVKNQLTLYLQDGTSIAFHTFYEGERIAPWKDFYKWFFGRTGEFYVIGYDVGETMVRRSDISRFNVHVYTE